MYLSRYNWLLHASFLPLNIDCLPRYSMQYSKTSDSERNQFSNRLHTCLLNNHVSSKPAAFARAFNLRAGTCAVTAHAARKWLVGEAIPTHERLLVLARWLDVNAAWLRFGGDEPAPVPLAMPIAHQMTANDAVLVRAIFELSGPSQAVIASLVESLIKFEQTMGPDMRGKVPEPFRLAKGR